MTKSYPFLTWNFVAEELRYFIVLISAYFTKLHAPTGYIYHTIIKECKTVFMHTLELFERGTLELVERVCSLFQQFNWGDLYLTYYWKIKFHDTQAVLVKIVILRYVHLLTISRKKWHNQKYGCFYETSLWIYHYLLHENLGNTFCYIYSLE